MSENIGTDASIVKAGFGAPAPEIEKITAAQVKEDCPKQLLDLGEQAAAHLTEAYAHKEEYEQRLAKAKEIIGQVRQLCDDDGFTAFYEIFHETFCPNVGRSRTYELLAIATGKTSIEAARAETRERVARHRAKKAESVTVTDSPPLKTDGSKQIDVPASPTGNDADPAASAAARMAAFAAQEANEPDSANKQPAAVLEQTAPPALATETKPTSAPDRSGELWENWQMATAAEQLAVLKAVLKKKGVDAILRLLKEDKDLLEAILRLLKEDKDLLSEFSDRIIGLQVALASPVTVSQSSTKLLTNLTGTLHWALGQDEPASGAQALKIIKAKLVSNKRNPKDICFSFAKPVKR
jgi:hypothetical protein